VGVRRKVKNTKWTKEEIDPQTFISETANREKENEKVNYL